MLTANAVDIVTCQAVHCQLTAPSDMLQQLDVLKHNVINRRREEQRVNPIEDPAVAGNQRGAVLDARAPFQHRLEQIARDAERHNSHAHERTKRHGHAREPPRADDDEDERAEDEPAERAFDGFAWG